LLALHEAKLDRFYSPEEPAYLEPLLSFSDPGFGILAEFNILYMSMSFRYSNTFWSPRFLV